MTILTIQLDDNLAAWLQQTSQVQRRDPEEIVQAVLRRQKALAELENLQRDLRPKGEFANMTDDEVMQVAIDTIKEVRQERRQAQEQPQLNFAKQ